MFWNIFETLHCATNVEDSYFVSDYFYWIPVEDGKGPARFLLRLRSVFTWFVEPSLSSVYDIRDFSSMSWSWNYRQLPSMLLSLSDSYCSGTESSVKIHNHVSMKYKEAKRWRLNHVGVIGSSHHRSQFLGCARCRGINLKDKQKNLWWREIFEYKTVFVLTSLLWWQSYGTTLHPKFYLVCYFAFTKKKNGHCICSPTRYTKFFKWLSLFVTYVSSTCFGPHRSIFRRVLHALCTDLVCAVT